MMTVGMAAMKWAAPGPAPTPSSSAPAAAASQITGPVTVTTTVGTTAMRTPPAGEEQHVRTAALPFRAICGVLPMHSWFKKGNEQKAKEKTWTVSLNPETISDCLIQAWNTIGKSTLSSWSRSRSRQLMDFCFNLFKIGQKRIFS